MTTVSFELLMIVRVDVLRVRDGVRDDGDLNALSSQSSRSRVAFICACVSSLVCPSKLIGSILLLFELVPLLLTASASLFSEVVSANRICVHAYATSRSYGSLLSYHSGLGLPLMRYCCFSGVASRICARLSVYW